MVGAQEMLALRQRAVGSRILFLKTALELRILPSMFFQASVYTIESMKT